MHVWEVAAGALGEEDSGLRQESADALSRLGSAAEKQARKLAFDHAHLGSSSGILKAHEAFFSPWVQKTFFF